MPQTLFKRRDDEVKRNGVPFHSRPPISRNVSYGMHQRHLNDKEEEWSILKPGTSQLGNWSESDLTDSGKLAKNIISNWPHPPE